MLFNTEKETGKDADISELEDVTPDFAKKDRCKDANMRSPSDPDYDPTTLYVPSNIIKTLTPTMK